MKSSTLHKPGRSIRHRFLLTALLASATIALAPLLFAASQPPLAGANGFRFADLDDRSLGLWEGDKPVFVYNHGVISKPGVPADRARSTYLHPIYGLDGEVLTDDFPKDHYHHRGLFWAWPHVNINNTEYSLWDLRGIEQRFVTWLKQAAGKESAILGVETGWFVGQKQVMREQAWLRTLPATASGRVIDVDLTWTPLDQPIVLSGAPGKSYGGLTLRFAPRTGTVITTPLGNANQDLAVTRLKWADLSAQFSGPPGPSGAAIFIAPDHPDYPPTWLTRHYGVLCLGWPGVEPKSLPAGQPVRCRYRIWIHRGAPAQAVIQRIYDDYAAAPHGDWN